MEYKENIISGILRCAGFYLSIHNGLIKKNDSFK